MLKTTSSHMIGPEFTPPVVKRIIWATVIASLLCSLANPMFHYFLGIPGPLDILSLSWDGLERLWIWQPLTSLLVQQLGFGGISLWSLLTLGFYMLVLWVFGSLICQSVGERQFLIFYVLAGITGNLATLFCMPLLGQYAILSGPAPCMMAILVVWTMLHPDSLLLIFMLFPIQAKWLLAGILGAVAVVNLSNLSFIFLVYSLTPAVFGYAYGVLMWGLKGPYAFTSGWEDYLLECRQTHKKSGYARKVSKIIDFQTGEPVDKDKDDEEKFLDEMLEKISQKGEESLSSHERSRLERISRKRSQKP